jgi:hypothetical protein
MTRKLSKLKTLFAATVLVGATPAGQVAFAKPGPKILDRPNGEGPYTPECLCSKDEKLKAVLHGCGVDGKHEGTCASEAEHGKGHACGRIKDPKAAVCGEAFQKKYGDPDQYIPKKGKKGKAKAKGQE